MLKINTKTLILLTALTLPMSSVSLAQDDHEMGEMHESQHHGKRGGKGLFKKLKELNLTAEQMEKIKELKKERKASKKEDRKSKREEMRALKEELREAFKSNKSSDELRAIKNKIKSYHCDGQDDKFEIMLKIREILTPEQRAKFDFTPDRRRGKHKD